MKSPIQRGDYPPSFMSQECIEYRHTASEAGGPGTPRTIAAAAVLIVILVGLNAFLLHVAVGDHSWIAFGIAIFFGPAANGVVMVVSLVCALVVVKRWTGWGWPSILFIVLSVVLPIAAAIIDFAVVHSLNLTGC